MQFVEFLEFVARVAEIKYKNGTFEGENGAVLAEKIELVLEDLCQAFGLVKNSVNIDIQENSASDDDY